jgi:hypothetical protein
MEEFKNLLKSTGKYLSPLGYKRKGLAFIREDDDFYSIILFQKYSLSNETKVSFSVNYGVTTKLILTQQGKQFSNCLVNSTYASDLSRLEKFEDQWLTIIKGNDVETAFEELKGYFENSLLKELDKIANFNFLFDDLLSSVEDNTRSLNFYVTEKLLILTKYKFSDKLNDVISLLNKNAKGENDRLFLREIFTELSITM